METSDQGPEQKIRGAIDSLSDKDLGGWLVYEDGSTYEGQLHLLCAGLRFELPSLRFREREDLRSANGSPMKIGFGVQLPPVFTAEDLNEAKIGTEHGQYITVWERRRLTQSMLPEDPDSTFTLERLLEETERAIATNRSVAARILFQILSERFPDDAAYHISEYRQTLEVKEAQLARSEATRNALKDCCWLEASGLLDARWYTRRYSVERPAALQHYLDPVNRMNDPNPLFKKSAYLKFNPDLEHTTMDLFIHYIFYGVHEKRQWLEHNDGSRLDEDAWRYGAL